MQNEYESICRKYYGRIYSFLYKMCSDKELTEDLTQETFYQAFISMHRYKGSSDMFTYIASIAKHLYFKHLKKSKHIDQFSDIGDISDYLTDEGALNPQEIYEQASERIRLKEAISRLPDKYRDIVLYRVYAEMTFAQAAQAMDITENSAKVLFFRAKNKLKEELNNEDVM